MFDLGGMVDSLPVQSSDIIKKDHIYVSMEEGKRSHDSYTSLHALFTAVKRCMSKNLDYKGDRSKETTNQIVEFYRLVTTEAGSIQEKSGELQAEMEQMPSTLGISAHPL